MSVRRSSARFLVLLCLFALQLQLFASSAMACKHTGNQGDGATVVCPFHSGVSTSRGIDKANSMLDCQKCALGFFLGGCHLIIAFSSLSVFGIQHIEAGSDLKHFYDFVPNRLDRPPISLRS